LLAELAVSGVGHMSRSAVPAELVVSDAVYTSRRYHVFHAYSVGKQPSTSISIATGNFYYDYSSYIPQ
jgi:hypothetical protein